MAGELLKADKVLKIGQRVEFYLEEDEEKFASRIEDITSAQLVVAMPMDAKRRPILPKEGERLYGMAIGDKCRYRFFSVYQNKSAIPIPVWYITKPEIVERYQNRAYVRVNKSLPVKIRIVDEEGKQGDVIETSTLDLSGNGVSFILGRAVPVHSHIALEFNNLPEIGTLQILSQVARCIVLEPKERGYQVGVRFMDLPRAVMNKLIRYIFILQREELAKGLTEMG